LEESVTRSLREGTMHRPRIIRPIRTVAIAAVFAVSVLGPGPAARAAIGGDRWWVARFNAWTDGKDDASSMAVTPDGSTVIVTGSSQGATATSDYDTVAYGASTGAVLWKHRYDGPAQSDDVATTIAVSPVGYRVYVTGSSRGTSSIDYATIAYDTVTGDRLWLRRFNGTADGQDAAKAAVVSPDGSTVIVTGKSKSRVTGFDYATVAYDATTGARRWTTRYDGSGLTDAASSIAVAPDGDTVIVTGRSSASNDDYLTIAYRTATGDIVWTSRYTGIGSANDEAWSVAAGSSGDRVYVTGSSGGDYATIAYDATAGNQVWVKRYDGSGHLGDSAFSVAVSPDASRVFITGTSLASPTNLDYATIGYDAAAGTRLWVTRYDGSAGGEDDAAAVTTSPDGTQVFVTGSSYGGSVTGFGYATIAYDATSGSTEWNAQYSMDVNGMGFYGNDFARRIAVDPRGSAVYVTGSSFGNGTDDDYATLRYAGPNVAGREVVPGRRGLRN
jgi:DNA-binding beta-propeller fold protein YncE